VAELDRAAADVGVPMTTWTPNFSALIWRSMAGPP
jgi:hypothetical protein